MFVDNVHAKIVRSNGLDYFGAFKKYIYFSVVLIFTLLVCAFQIYFRYQVLSKGEEPLTNPLALCF